MAKEVTSPSIGARSSDDEKVPPEPVLGSYVLSLKSSHRHELTLDGSVSGTLCHTSAVSR